MTFSYRRLNYKFLVHLIVNNLKILMANNYRYINIF